MAHRFYFRICLRPFPGFHFIASLPTETVLENAVNPGLPKLGMMISQTRVSDTGPDVK